MSETTSTTTVIDNPYLKAMDDNLSKLKAEAVELESQHAKATEQQNQIAKALQQIAVKHTVVTGQIAKLEEIKHSASKAEDKKD